MMGANVWRHAPSIAAMSNRKLRLYLRADRAGLAGLSSNAHRLNAARPTDNASITQVVNLANRADIDRPIAGGGVVSTEIDTVDVLQTALIRLTQQLRNLAPPTARHRIAPRHPIPIRPGT